MVNRPGGHERNTVARRSANEPIAVERNQNRKYRCAIGSTDAGSQVSSTPSART